MDGRTSEQEQRGGKRGGPTGSDKTHTDSGAPTDEAHGKAGDGALTGSIPAGLTPDELEDVADEDRGAEPGTG